MEDREIIAMLRKRDEQALSEIEKKYRKYLLKIAYNILGNESDCEECLNDTLSSAWNSISLNSPDNLRLYLARIIKNKAINKVNLENAAKRGGGQYVAALDELEDIVSSEEGPEEMLMNSIDRQFVQSFLESLPEKEQNLFVRRYWYCDSPAEIAKMYGTNSMYVNMKLHRIRGRLKKKLIEIEK